MVAPWQRVWSNTEERESSNVGCCTRKGCVNNLQLDTYVLLRVCDHGESERIIINIAYCQTRSIHGDISLWDNVLHHRLVALDRVPERIFFFFDFVDGLTNVFRIEDFLS